jgi:hypothetical protein
MAEVLAEFSGPVIGANGIAYRGQAVGAPMNGSLWEGWIEFIPVGGGTPLRTSRETTQPNHRDAVYWATGLTAVYLEGALERALNPHVREVRPPTRSLFDEPAPRNGDVVSANGPSAEAILDPFSVYEKGEGLLRQELHALEAWHLVNIIIAYELSDEPISVLNRLPADTLIDIIVGAVRGRSSVRR